MKDHVRKAMEKALIDIDGQLWGKTYVPDEFVEKFAEYLMQTQPLNADEIERLREYHGINDWLYETSVIDFARAIEKAHGIE